jgi:hypothetical protein
MYLIYMPNGPFPAQEGPVCYFYSLMRAMQFQNQDYLSEIPSYCWKIAQDITASYTLYCQNFDKIELFDDYVDDIFKSNLTDLIIASLSLYLDDEPIETVDEFMGEYSHYQAMALLLGFKLDPTEKVPHPVSIEFFNDALRNYGPFCVDGDFGLVGYDLTPQYLHEKENVVIHSVQPSSLNGQHNVLIIGCQKYPTEELFYIDPGYPELILSISLEEFNNRSTNLLSILYKNKNQLAPSNVNVEEKSYSKLEKYQDHISINKRPLGEQFRLLPPPSKNIDVLADVDISSTLIEPNMTS